MSQSESETGSVPSQNPKSKMADDESEIRSPLGVTTDDDTPKKGLVTVTAVIPDLEVKKTITMKTELKNGTINHSFKEQSLTINLVLQKKSGPLRYRVQYRKLPDKIIPEDCSFKLKAGKVIITLKKADDRSWARELSSTGLETENPDET